MPTSRAKRAAKDSIYHLRSPWLGPNLGVMFGSMLVSAATPTKAPDGTLNVVGGMLTMRAKPGPISLGVAFAIGVEGHDDVDARISLALIGPDGKSVGKPKEYRETLSGKGFMAQAFRHSCELPKGNSELTLIVNGQRVAMCRIEAS
jgi:hypothetical protein